MNIEMYRLFFQVQQKHWWFVTRKKVVLAAIDSYVDKNIKLKILDIGCGSGVMLTALEKLGQTFGMDMSDEAITFSKEIFNGNVEKGFLPDQLPYEPDFFNLITALDVIEHIDQDVESLQAIYSLLNSEGKAIITVPAYLFLWSKFDDLNEHKRRYTLTELRTKLITAGFTIEKISYYNTLLFPIVFLVRLLNNILQRDGASDIDIPNAFLNYILEKVFSLEISILRWMNLPFGVSIIAVVSK
jgi:2-polyprenyl-3-methyl-5-hydroxy-6-metoxy-1,4-benzoquinol methylase